MRAYLRLTLLVLAAAGMGVMGYLISLHYAPETGQAFCTFGEGLSCEVVNKSLYSEIFGIPMAVLGFLYFAGVFALAVLRYTDTMLRYVFLGTIAFLGPSLYLTGIELTVLDNICVFCELSKVLMLAVAGVALWAIWDKRPSIQAVGIAVVAAIAFAGITYYAHATVVPAGTYTEFAQCLDESGFIMYGSEGCSFCARQRALFGDAFEHITEIECDPRFPSAQVERCVEKDIEHTPTWIQEDGAGNTLYRFEAGLLPLKRLSEVSECPLGK